MDTKTKNAIKHLMNTNQFSKKWIMNKFCISKAELNDIIHKKKKVIKKDITKAEKYLKDVELVKQVCKEYPDLSIKDKAEKIGLSMSCFNSIKHKFGIKQDHYVLAKELTNRKKEIREKYSTGLYTYQALGNEYGITRERIRQICGDIHVKLKKENGLKYIRKTKVNKEYVLSKKYILYIFAKAYLEYNRSILTINEIINSYYIILNEKKIEKLPKRSTIFYTLYDLCKTNGDKYIHRLYRGNYSLTEFGLSKIDNIIREIED